MAARPPRCAPIRPSPKPIWVNNRGDTMDLILRNARLAGAELEPADIGIENGRIAVVQPQLAAEGETIDLGGRLVTSGLIETHIHLDKSCILDRVTAAKGDLEEAIQEVARVKRD